MLATCNVSGYDMLYMQYPELILITFPADRDPAADPWPLELNLKPNCIGSVVRLLFNFHMYLNSGRRH